MSRTRRARALAAALTFAALLIGTAAPAGAATPPTGDVYDLANGCFALRDTESGAYVVDARGGFALGSSTLERATPLRLQATRLGSYLLYGPGGRMPQATRPVTATRAPGLVADWAIREAGRGQLRIVSRYRGEDLTVKGDALTTAADSDPRWAMVRTTGCADFPELQVGATGEPLRGASPDAPVRGFLDSHTHVSAYRFLGGRFHCGAPWSPYGVTVALRDCSDHAPDGSLALAENLLSYGRLDARHKTTGWPSFAGWPTHDSLTHESTYWKWLERAWRGGVRVMVNDLVENRALCEIYPLKRNPCNEMISARGQAAAMHELQDYIDAQFGGPGRGFLRIVTSPEQARAVINDGKLAMVLGIEVSELLDCRLRGPAPIASCTPAAIDRRLDELQALGVQSAFVAHKFDNALAGTTFDGGATGLLVNIGQKYATGRWWTSQRCPAGQEPDNTPPSVTGESLELYRALGLGAGKWLLADALPVYPPGPRCNPKGLTALGAHLIEGMAERGMLVELDHMSVKARTASLDLLEQLGYPGAVSSHTWSDQNSQARMQRLGGLVSPYGRDANTYAELWEQARDGRLPGAAGAGFGSDSNGLGAQPGPRGGPNPVVYPYRTFDGGTLMERQPAGSRTFDVNVDGVANYGLFPDWVEDLRQVAGDEIVDDLSRGAEAYLQLWERSRGWEQAGE